MLWKLDTHICVLSKRGEMYNQINQLRYFLSLAYVLRQLFERKANIVLDVRYKQKHSSTTE